MDEARARDVLEAADVLPGPARDARLLALGENAVFAAGDLVVKVGRDAELLDRARRELDVALWLAESGVPAVRAAEPKARLVEGHPVTVWHRLADSVRPAEPRDLAKLLRVVHALPSPPSSSRPASCWAVWSAGCVSRATRSIRRTRRICGSGGTVSRRPPPRLRRICRRGRFTVTRFPAMCMSGRTGRCWSIWRPSPRICVSTTLW